MAFLLGIFFFVMSAVTDVVWARYTGYVSERERLKAAVTAALIILLGCLGWVAYHTSLWYVIPMAAGAATGTFLGTKKKVQSADQS